MWYNQEVREQPTVFDHDTFYTKPADPLLARLLSAQRRGRAECFEWDGERVWYFLAPDEITYPEGDIPECGRQLADPMKLVRRYGRTSLKRRLMVDALNEWRRRNELPCLAH